MRDAPEFDVDDLAVFDTNAGKQYRTVKGPEVRDE